MIKDIYLKKRLVSSWFKLIQQTICYEFEKIEHDLSKKTGQKPKCFEKKTWQNQLFSLAKDASKKRKRVLTRTKLRAFTKRAYLLV